jgi:hypothetical protein
LSTKVQPKASIIKKGRDQSENCSSGDFQYEPVWVSAEESVKGRCGVWVYLRMCESGSTGYSVYTTSNSDST